MPSVEDYARILDLASAHIGPRRVANILASWTCGESIRVRGCALLKGNKTEAELSPVNGVSLRTLGGQSDFPHSLRIDGYDIRQEQFGGRAMLCIDYETDPALYDPDNAPRNEFPSTRRRDLVNPKLTSVARGFLPFDVPDRGQPCRLVHTIGGLRRHRSLLPRRRLQQH